MKVNDRVKIKSVCNDGATGIVTSINPHAHTLQYTVRYDVPYKDQGNTYPDCLYSEEELISFDDQHAQDAIDAAKWRALTACARITCMGYAGLGEKTYDNHYAHATFNFWTIMDQAYQDTDEQAQWGRKHFEQFIEIALKAQQKD